MVEYNKVNVKLSSFQFSKLKTAAKNNEGTTLRLGKKIDKQESPHELFLIRRQTPKLRNKTENDLQADIKLGRTQIKK